MKKHLLSLGVAATMALGAASTTGIAAVPVQKVSQEQCSVINHNIEGNEKMKELLENCGIHVEILFQNSCPEMPGGIHVEDCKPGTSVPENCVPETAPETQEPETSAPEMQQPETSAPENQLPENTTPETQAPSTSPESSVHPYVLRVLELVNEERAAAGLNAVTLDTAASQAALVRAKETVTSFSHTRPDGRNFTTALTEQGVNYRMAGENIAWGQRSPEQVMEGWMNSSGHRANILNASYTHIGIGYHQENGVNYWTQLFFK